jgi:hypothetical protein
VKLLALTVGVFWAVALSGQGKPEDCSIRLESDGTATVRGVVRRNDHGCANDGQCVLIVRCNGRDVDVVYTAGGDLPEDTNAYRRALASGATDAAHILTAGRARSGELIEAHGSATVSKSELTGIRIYYDGSWMKVLSSAGAETIVIDAPRGPTAVSAGTPYTYSVQAISSLSHLLHYTVDWGDGQRTVVWESTASWTHTWHAPGVYQVTVDARCGPDEIPAVKSEALTVTVR